MQSIIEAVDLIRRRRPHFIPRLGLVLGSGLGAVADAITDATRISFSELPGFPVSTVVGHSGQLILGFLNKVPVACLQGRPHRYEGVPDASIRLVIRTLKMLGCEELILTNAAGSLRAEVAPGELMLITDHINFQPGNPLVGPNDDTVGPRFFALDPAYDLEIQANLQAVASKHNIVLYTGVYLATLGPNYETPAEIRAFRILGADAVGMSTVPEVLVARHCGLRVGAISSITNFAAGMSTTPANHAEVLEQGAIAAKNLTRLILGYTEVCYATH